MPPEFAIDNPNHEQRRNPRADLFQELACEGDGVVVHSQVADTLSNHGACLRVGYALDVGMKLLLETPRGGEFKGNVVWVGSEASKSGGQVGVQCRGLAQLLGFQFP